MLVPSSAFAAGNRVVREVRDPRELEQREPSPVQMRKRTWLFWRWLRRWRVVVAGCVVGSRWAGSRVTPPKGSSRIRPPFECTMDPALASQAVPFHPYLTSVGAKKTAPFFRAASCSILPPRDELCLVKSPRNRSNLWRGTSCLEYPPTSQLAFSVSGQNSTSTPKVSPQ